MRQHRCPKCKGDMHARNRDGLTVAVCDDCRGIWIDTPMLDLLAQRTRSRDALAELAAWVEREPATRRTYECPSCKEAPLELHAHGDLEIDWCRTCKGLYLDRGELQAAVQSHRNREVAASDQERNGDVLEKIEDRRGSIVYWLEDLLTFWK